MVIGGGAVVVWCGKIVRNEKLYITIVTCGFMEFFMNEEKFYVSARLLHK